LDHWDNARVTGAIAGANMAGADERYAITNYWFSDVFDVTLNAWGEPRQVDRRLIRGTRGITGPDSPDFIEIGIAADGRVAQVLSVGHQGEDAVLEQLVHRRLPVEGREETLKDPDQPLKQLLA